MFDNSVLQRQQAANELETISYEAKNIQNEKAFEYFDPGLGP